MFRKARIEEEDVEACFNGSVKNSEWEFKVVAEKMAKLEETPKRGVFWPRSLKQFVHEQLNQYREAGESDSYDSMFEAQKTEFWVRRYTEDQVRNFFYPLDKAIDVDHIITNEPWQSFAQASFVTSCKEIYKNRVSVKIVRLCSTSRLLDVFGAHLAAYQPESSRSIQRTS